MLSERSIKIVSWLAILGGGFSVLSQIWLLIVGQLPIAIGPFLFLCLSVVGVVGGWLTLKNRLRGKKLLVLFYIPQLVSYDSHSFYWSFKTSIYLSYGWGANSAYQVGFNFYAFIMLILCLRILQGHKNLTRQASGTPQSGAPS